MSGSSVPLRIWAKKVSPDTRRQLERPASYGSCSHGAGRVMSRKEAHAAIDARHFAASMSHVVYPEQRGRALIEEAPAAYRDIVEVLDQQKDLVRRRRRLEPLAVLEE